MAIALRVYRPLTEIITSSRKAIVKIPRWNAIHTRPPTLAGGVGLKQKNGNTADVNHPYGHHVAELRHKDFLANAPKLIIYEDESLLVFNKPAGLPMRGGRDLTKLEPHEDIVPSMKEVLQSLELPYFREVVSQPRLFSGLVVYAKDPYTFEKLQKYMRHCRAQKLPVYKFLAVLTGVPTVFSSPLMELPLSRFLINERELSIKEKRVSSHRKQTGNQILAVVGHSTLQQSIFNKATNAKASLVQFEAVTSKWDALEVYSTKQLLCSILGDHRYSSRLAKIKDVVVHLDPFQCSPVVQKLSADFGQALLMTDKLCQGMPLHLHCHTIQLPKLKVKGQQITINAKLPSYFEWTLEKLNLKSTEDVKENEKKSDVL